MTMTCQPHAMIPLNIYNISISTEDSLVTSGTTLTTESTTTSTTTATTTSTTEESTTEEQGNPHICLRSRPGSPDVVCPSVRP